VTLRRLQFVHRVKKHLDNLAFTYDNQRSFIWVYYICTSVMFSSPKSAKKLTFLAIGLCLAVWLRAGSVSVFDVSVGYFAYFSSVSVFQFRLFQKPQLSVLVFLLRPMQYNIIFSNVIKFFFTYFLTYLLDLCYKAYSLNADFWSKSLSTYSTNDHEFFAATWCHVKTNKINVRA